MAKSKTNISKIDKYVKGRLNARDMHELERETYDDAFLGEAMEGFEDFAADDHEETISGLKAQLTARVSPSKNKRLLMWRVLPIAASVLLILGVGYWFSAKDDVDTKKEEHVVKRTSTKLAIAVKDTVDAGKPTRNLIVANVPVKHKKIKATNEPEKVLMEVAIANAPTIKYKTDTVEYVANDYKVRANASVEEMLKKAEGFEVDSTGAVLFKGQSVAKARLNGKDYMGGDVDKAIQNLPADIVEKFQVVDDYGDQAGRTGIRRGDPDKVLNLSIKQISNRDTVEYFVVEILTDTVGLPRPVIGWEGFKSYISDNAFISDGSMGQVEVAFHVNSLGEVTQAHIIEGYSKASDEKALTIIANGPKWRGATVTKEVRLRIFFYRK